MLAETPNGLRLLAKLHGIQTEFVDSAGVLHRAGPEELIAVLKALDAPVEGPEDVDEALRLRRRTLGGRPIEPVAVAWDGIPPTLRVCIPDRDAPIRCRLVGEDGRERTWSPSPEGFRPDAFPPTTDGERLAAFRLTIPGLLATGYHRLKVEVGDESLESLVISAPTRVFQGDPNSGRTWGVFCPLHALHSGSSTGAGDFSDLGALMDWVGSLGGGLVSTLPMLATDFSGDRPISPYSPSSRLFWNELHVDPTRAPELAVSEAARAVLASEDYRREAEALRAAPLVDYRRQMLLKRSVLEPLAESAFDVPDSDRKYRGLLFEHAEASRYASFMAARETSRYGVYHADDPAARRAWRYHFYVQQLADRQLGELAGRSGVAWCVDFPAGVDASGFDVSRWPDLFAAGATIGCPPDEDFTRAQDWCFPPIRPERHRETGYAYWIAALRHHFRHAGAVRIDHVMGLHRLYWLPKGGGPDRLGAYVSYPSDELYAILSVESHRQGAWLVGEDLGTIPPEVPLAMRRHGLRGLYVVEHEVKKAGPDRPLPAIPEATVASVNTHDLPPFASFWAGKDIAERAACGLLDGEKAAAETGARPAIRASLAASLRDAGLLDGPGDDPADVLRALARFLAGSPAAAVVVNLEDLWLESEPQNLPGTCGERPNWRHRLRFSLEELAGRTDVVESLRQVDGLRRGDPAP